MVAGTIATFAALTNMFEGHTPVETDVAWEAAFATTRDHPRGETWTVTHAHGVAFLTSPTTTFGLGTADGTIRWVEQIDFGQHQPHHRPADGDLSVLSTEGGLLGIEAVTGSMSWRHHAADEQIFGLSVAQNVVSAVIYDIGPDGMSWRVDVRDATTGSQLWQHLSEGPDTQITSADTDGHHVYIATVDIETTLQDEEILTGTTIHSYDAQTGDEAWSIRWDEQDAERLTLNHVDGSLLATGQHRIFGIDPQHGDVDWRRDEAATINASATNANALVVVKAADRSATVSAFNVEDGMDLWDWPIPGGPGQLTVDDDIVTLTTTTEQDWAAHTLDARTGEPLWETDLGTQTGQHDQRPSVALSDNAVLTIDVSHTLRAIDRETGHALWTMRPTTDNLRPAPDVIDGETIHVVGDDGTLRILDGASGDERWAQRLGTATNSPALHHNGRLFAVAALGDIRAFDLDDGRELWRSERTLKGLAATPPRPIVTDGTVIAVGGQTMLAVDIDTGNRRWAADLDAEGRGIAVLDEGDLMTTELNGSVRRFTMDGTQLWHVRVSRSINASPAIHGGTAVIGAEGEIIAINVEDGRVRWTADLESAFHANPTIHGEFVYVPDGDALISLSLDGEPRWHTETSEALIGRPHATSDNIHVSSRAEAVLQFDPNTGELLRRIEAGAPLASSPTTLKQTVLVLTREQRQRLLALR